MPALPCLRLSRRPFASVALAFVMSATLGQFVAQAAPILDVTLDQAKISRVPEGTKTLVVGSPIVADVTLLKGSNTMVVTGKGFGETNLIALDGDGNVLDERMIRVAPTNTVLVVQRGMDRESYSCTPVCMPSVQLGDGPQFANASGQITARNSLETPAGAPQGH
jgi:Pilus formation protein N terminal region